MQRLVVVTEVRLLRGEVHHGTVMAGIEFYRLEQRQPGIRSLSLLVVAEREGKVRVSEARIEGESFASHLYAGVDVLRVIKICLKNCPVGHASLSHRELGIQPDGLVQHPHCFEVLLAIRRFDFLRTQVEVIRLHVLSRPLLNALLLIRGEVGLQGRRDAQRHVALHSEDVLQFPVVLLGPDGPVVARIDELHVNADT